MRLVKLNDMTSLQTCPMPYCRYADFVLMEEIIQCFKHSDRLARHVCEALHPHSVGLEVTTELLYKLNEPYTKLRVAFFFLARVYFKTT